MRAYYFGCWDETGHYLWTPTRVRALPDTQTPWGTEMDGSMQPVLSETRWSREQAPNGQCIVHHKNEWTALAFWDNSVDKRGASCSVFVVEGLHAFWGATTLFQTQFPSVYARLDCPLSLHSVCECPVERHARRRP